MGRMKILAIFWPKNGTVCKRILVGGEEANIRPESRECSSCTTAMQFKVITETPYKGTLLYFCLDPLSVCLQHTQHMFNNV